VPYYFKGCQPIDYYIRQNYATESDISLVSDALSILETGYPRSFNFKGFTEEENSVKSAILINFASPSEFSQVKTEQSDASGEAAGLGSMGSFEEVNSPRWGSQASDSGVLWVNQDYWLTMTRDEKLFLMIHEVGHVLGLDHPQNGTNQIMNGDADYFYPVLGSGDKLGLQILSALAGCSNFPDYLLDDASTGSAPSTNTDNGQSNESVYDGTTDEEGNAGIRRNLLASATNSCGNDFPYVVLKLNSQIPGTWMMTESDGCGSGRAYTWRDPGDAENLVYLELSASIGWCQNIGPDDVDLIAESLVYNYGDFSRLETLNQRFIYAYNRLASPNDSLRYGLVEVGEANQWCGDAGTTTLEIGQSISQGSDLFDQIFQSVFSDL
jgi:hypothetical protein